MSISNVPVDWKSCHKFVVVRWKKENETSCLLETEIVNFINSLGYKLSFLKTSQSSDSEQFLLLQLENENETNSFCSDARLTEYEITQVSTNPLIGFNGIRIKDANDILKSVSVNKEMSDIELMDLLISLFCFENSGRAEIAEEELKILKDGISEIIENGICTTFGSYPSPFRRNAYSDIDLAVSSNEVNSETIRPLKMVIDNPKCLLEKPLTKAEFYSYPQEEIIKAIYHCLVDKEIFRERFQMRLLLVRTPIVIFQSTKVPEMKMSYDVSVNNQISVEKSKILSDFIQKDISFGNKMKYVTMFIIHWAKTNKLLGGVYPNEKLVTKYKFNSYIVNQLIIHFIQISAEKVLVHTLEEPENRVIEYNFDELFENYAHFLKRFFSYFLNFDYEQFGIFGIQVIEKSKLAETQKVKISPLMMVDPLDFTHNLSQDLIEDGLKLFKDLMRKDLEKLNHPDFRITDLL